MTGREELEPRPDALPREGDTALITIASLGVMH